MAPSDDSEPEPFERLRIFVDGEPTRVPVSVTILDALILSGHRYLRGCGCREGDCGECTVRVREPGARNSASELACEAQVRPDIEITQIPFQWNRAFQNRRRMRR